jgi:hypothetical protein
MRNYLNGKGIKMFDYAHFAEPYRGKIRAHIEQTAIFETLDKIQYVQYNLNGIKVKMLPKKFNQHQQQIIDMLNFRAPILPPPPFASIYWCRIAN